MFCGNLIKEKEEGMIRRRRSRRGRGRGEDRKDVDWRRDDRMEGWGGGRNGMVWLEGMR